MTSERSKNYSSLKFRREANLNLCGFEEEKKEGEEEVGSEVPPQLLMHQGDKEEEKKPDII